MAISPFYTKNNIQQYTNQLLRSKPSVCVDNKTTYSPNIYINLTHRYDGKYFVSQNLCHNYKDLAKNAKKSVTDWLKIKESKRSKKYEDQIQKNYCNKSILINDEHQCNALYRHHFKI